MGRIRSWLWKSLGITLDREAKMVGGMVVGGTLLTILFGILFLVTHTELFVLLAALNFAVTFFVTFGSSYSAASWGLASKEERKKIEEEMALKQLKRRTREKHFQP